MLAEMQVFGHAAADAGDADVLIRRTYDHVKLQVCAGIHVWIVGTSKIAIPTSVPLRAAEVFCDRAIIEYYQEILTMEIYEIYEHLETAEGIASLLALDDFTPVYELADRIRAEHVGDIVHLRAIIEFSNVCKRQCIYCGLNRENRELERFRMSRDEIIEAAAEAVDAGYRTIVLQSGEDDGTPPEDVVEIIKDIKKLRIRDPWTFAESPSVSEVAPPAISSFVGSRQSVEGSAPAAKQAAEQLAPISDPYSPAITLSCGEKSEAVYRLWREAGAERYLLKHETADPELYDRLHPCGTLDSRVKCLKTLRALGYETGSGFMIGLPGQTLETVAKDILLLKSIPCRMAGIGPFISNPRTPLAGSPDGDPELARRAVAVARLLLPDSNLPLTTSLSILAGKEQYDPGEPLVVENPFAFGANVVMKKATPDKYKEAYEIYPAQFKPTHIAEDRKELEEMIMRCGRRPR